MNVTVPEWLVVMRTLTGMVETPGAPDNPKILAMAEEVGRRFPDMASYAALYQHDATPWCGLTAAYCMAMCDPPIRPPFGNKDTDRWLWALSWSDDAEFGTLLADPRPGCVVCLKRSGGGHVTFLERVEGKNLICRGGNQSDSVNTASYPMSDVVALVWPRDGGPLPPPPTPAERRELERGDSGPDVKALQMVLGIPADGEFGAVTESAVRAYQAAVGIAADGIVGPQTWAKVDELAARLKAGTDGLPVELRDQIIALAKASPLMDFSWPSRGRSPPGYIPGMALAFGLAAVWLEDAYPEALAMARADTGDPASDALTWYRSEFAQLGMDNSVGGIDVLRHLFVLLIGLGMRESSGEYCCGRDMSASNVSADTAEAGLFQMSWNMRTASPQMLSLFEDYITDPNGFLPTFQEGVEPSAADLQSYGTGQGATYQWLAKYSPTFAAMTAAIGLRTRRQHWGPINRKEVTLSSTADELLVAVQSLVAGAAPEPEPEPEPEPGIAEVTITVRSKGAVKVNIVEEP
jgi:uncharacterized protein (TIGR02594 family)